MQQKRKRVYFILGYIYKIENNINGKLYIGQTVDVDARWKKHLSVAQSEFIPYRSHLYNAIKKYGKEHFSINVIETCSYDDMDKREAYWIRELNSLEPNGYNITPGGKKLHGSDNPFFGKHHSEKTKQIISQKNTGRKASDEEKEMRRKINSGERNPFYGKRHSKETIELIRHKNISNGLYRKSSERMKENNPCRPDINSKPVIMIDKYNNPIMAFQSMSSAGEYIKSLGLSKAKYPGNMIGNVCRGKAKSAFGFNWTILISKLKQNGFRKDNTFVIGRK